MGKSMHTKKRKHQPMKNENVRKTKTPTMKVPKRAGQSTNITTTSKKINHFSKKNTKTTSLQAQRQNPTNKNDQRMSTLQQEMKKRLEGGKFRMLNEQLYTTTGAESFESFQEEPELFDIYHQGFREQVEKWPVNPVDIIIRYIKSQPKVLVIGDFGCGDAKLAASVKNVVHSFDLVSRNERVIAADIAHVPLERESLDIAVYSLALMGTNMMDYIREGYRVLKINGIMKIAEVKSRFEVDGLEGVKGFVRMMYSLGFDLLGKNEDNKMFVMLDFRKTKRPPSKVSTLLLKVRTCNMQGGG